MCFAFFSHLCTFFAHFLKMRHFCTFFLCFLRFFPPTRAHPPPPVWVLAIAALPASRMDCIASRFHSLASHPVLAAPAVEHPLARSVPDARSLLLSNTSPPRPPFSDPPTALLASQPGAGFPSTSWGWLQTFVQPNLACREITQAPYFAEGRL